MPILYYRHCIIIKSSLFEYCNYLRLRHFQLAYLMILAYHFLLRIPWANMFTLKFMSWPSRNEIHSIRESRARHVPYQRLSRICSAYIVYTDINSILFHTKHTFCAELYTEFCYACKYAAAPFVSYDEFLCFMRKGSNGCRRYVSRSYGTNIKQIARPRAGPNSCTVYGRDACKLELMLSRWPTRWFGVCCWWKSYIPTIKTPSERENFWPLKLYKNTHALWHATFSVLIRKILVSKIH